MTALEGELKELIVTALQLRDVSVDDIDSSTPLFDGGLGLDSVDILELGVALDDRYGIRVQPEDPEHRKAFETLGSLVSFVESERAKPA